jgi:hypothetical protein
MIVRHLLNITPSSVPALPHKTFNVLATACVLVFLASVSAGAATTSWHYHFHSAFSSSSYDNHRDDTIRLVNDRLYLDRSISLHHVEINCELPIASITSIVLWRGSDEYPGAVNVVSSRSDVVCQNRQDERAPISSTDNYFVVPLVLEKRLNSLRTYPAQYT